MKPDAKIGFSVSTAQMRTKAFELITEANDILEKPEIREKMRLDSILGELTELGCYKKALSIANEAKKILEEIQPENLPAANDMIDKITAKINEIEKPIVVPEPEKEEIQVTSTFMPLETPEVPEEIPKEVPKKKPKKKPKKSKKKRRW